MYVGSTTILTEPSTPAEKGKVQAIHDFIVFSFVAVVTFLAGRVFHRFDWTILNQMSWPLVLFTLLVVLWFQQKTARAQRLV